MKGEEEGDRGVKRSEHNVRRKKHAKRESSLTYSTLVLPSIKIFFPLPFPSWHREYEFFRYGHPRRHTGDNTTILSG